jgi:hypothetical protein
MRKVGMLNCLRFISVELVLVSLAGFASSLPQATSSDLEWTRVSDDGSHFAGVPSGRPFIVWAVNYDHDRHGRLLEDYWCDEWPTVIEDFGEIKQLGMNTVRVHLQLNKFMCTAESSNNANLARLADLVKLAERTGLYLNITGLGCYNKSDIPPWYDKLSESERWQVQRRFWQSVAKVCRSSPAVFCYDLMNEPVVPGHTRETSWLAGEFAGKYFVQRIALDLAGRTQIDVAKAWVTELSSGIREIDDRHMITVGVIPWANVFRGAKPLFYSPEVSGPIDFVSVHFYPKRGDVDTALTALRVYAIGKPLVIEEIYPLNCTIDEAARFIDGSRNVADGWTSFYWGETSEECRQHHDRGHAIMAHWLERFSAQAKQPDICSQ